MLKLIKAACGRSVQEISHNPNPGKMRRKGERHRFAIFLCGSRVGFSNSQGSLPWVSTTRDLLNFPVEQLSLDKLGTQLMGWLGTCITPLRHFPPRGARGERSEIRSCLESNLRFLRLDISLLAERGGERSEIRSIILQPAFGASVPCRHGSSIKYF